MLKKELLKLLEHINDEEEISLVRIEEAAAVNDLDYERYELEIAAIKDNIVYYL